MANNDETFESEQYTLRAGTPMYIKGDFILQTFGVDKYKIILKPATTEVANSNDFRGEGGDYISGNYNRLQDKTGLVYNGRLVFSPEFVDESDIE